MEKNGRATKAVHDTRRSSGRHAAEAVSAEIESIGDRATKLVHQAIEEVVDSIQSGKNSILEHTREVKDAAEEKITKHPYAAIGAAFAVGLVTTAVLRWTMRSRE